MDSDAQRWNDRYRGVETGEPKAPKGLDGIELSRDGLCLDVACGLGAQSLWAAEQGYQVVSLDASEVAVSALRRAATKRGWSDRIQAVVFDLDDGLPDDLESRGALVICQRFRHPDLLGPLVSTLRPGGVLVLTVLSQVGRTGEPGRFHAPPGELIEAISAWRQLVVEFHLEADGEATIVARHRVR